MMTEINKDRLKVGDIVYIIASDCHNHTNSSCPTEECKDCRFEHLYISVYKIGNTGNIERFQGEINKSIFLTSKDAEDEMIRRGKRVCYTALS